jgi:rhomboid protease GluP
MPVRLPLAPSSVATFALIAINSLIFVVTHFVLSPQELRDVYSWGASNHTAVLQHGEYYRLITAMFLHGGLPHVLFNMYALYIIGQTVERFFGTTRFLLIYFLGGLGGSVLSVLLNPPAVTSVGASGAVFAIFGAEMIFLYRHRQLLGPAATFQLRQLLVIAGINFVYGIATSLAPGDGVRIDNWGHVGGWLGGLALAWIIGPMLVVRPHPQEPGTMVGEDINPLQDRYQPLLAYTSFLLALLVVGTLVVRVL